MNNRKLKLSLIIPGYNESANLPVLFKSCKKLIDSLNHELEIIFVNNGSTDNTHEVLADLLLIYPNIKSILVQTNQGYGYGVLQGLKAANGEILAWTHADMQTDPNDLIYGFNLIPKDYDNFYIKGLRKNRKFIDCFFTFGMSIFESILFKMRLWDINAQPTIITRKFFQTWQFPPNDFSLDLYTYHLAKKNKLRIIRFPVKFDKRLHGISSWNKNWSSKMKFIKRTVTYSINLNKGKLS